ESSTVTAKILLPGGESFHVVKIIFTILESQFFHRVPEFFFKINDRIILHFYSFFFQKRFHAIATKMFFATEHSIPVYDPVRRNFWFYCASSIHRPAHHSRRHFSSETSGNSAI